MFNQQRVQKPKVVAAKATAGPTDMALDDDYEMPRQPSPPKRKPPPRAIASASAPKKPALSSMSKPTAAPPASSAAGPKKAAKLPPSAPAEPVRYKFSPEDAEERFTEYVPADIATQITDSQWKIRLAGNVHIIVGFTTEWPLTCVRSSHGSAVQSFGTARSICSRA